VDDVASESARRIIQYIFNGAVSVTVAESASVTQISGNSNDVRHELPLRTEADDGASRRPQVGAG
jgi:hypothetical protein